MTVVDSLIWLALAGGAAAALAALWGRYRTLPAFLTGPEICQLDDGGCAVLFRTGRAALLGIPNAALGVLLYVLLALGLVVGVTPWLLWMMTFPAIMMSAVLARSLVVNHHQCRVCWTGHVCNAGLFILLLWRAVHG